MKKLFVLMLVILVISMVPMVLADDDNAYLKATLLNQDPDPANPGDYVELRWKIEKFGSGDLTNVVFELEPSYPFSFDSSDIAVKELGTWSGFSDNDEFYTLYYKILVDDDAIEDSYDLNLKIISDQFDLEKDFSIRVGDKEEASFTLGQLVTSPLKLYGDSDENTLDVTLENIGDSDAEVVVVDLELPEGFDPTYGFSTRANLGTVSQGGNKVATFYVDIDESVSEGLYDGELRVSYSDDDQKKIVLLPLSIPVSGKPKFEITSVSFSEENIAIGSLVDMTVGVTNIGTKEAESVSLRVFKESSQPFTFEEKSDFIGRLAPGESGVAIVSFTVDDDASVKDFLLDLEVRGIYNQEVLVDDGVATISVNSDVSANSGILGMKMSVIIALVLLVLTGFVSYKVGVSKH